MECTCPFHSTAHVAISVSLSRALPKSTLRRLRHCSRDADAALNSDLSPRSRTPLALLLAYVHVVSYRATTPRASTSRARASRRGPFAPRPYPAHQRRVVALWVDHSAAPPDHRTGRRAGLLPSTPTHGYATPHSLSDSLSSSTQCTPPLTLAALFLCCEGEANLGLGSCGSPLPAPSGRKQDGRRHSHLHAGGSSPRERPPRRPLPA